MDTTAIREKIRTYIAQSLINDPDYQLEDDEGIITGSLIDSTDLAELAVYIESEFDVYIPDPELTVAKMDTLDLIVARVVRGLA
ncbi:MAG: acyl carrier protein [Phototrophicaceae bacterium]